MQLPDTRAGLHTLRICRAEFCRSKGCDQIIDHVEKRVGAKLGETTLDGTFSLEEVYCLGNCGSPPSVLLDGKIHGHVSPQVADLLIDEIRRRQEATEPLGSSGQQYLHGHR